MNYKNSRPAILKRKRRPAQPGEQTTTPTITQIEFTPRIRIRSFSDPDISNMMISAVSLRGLSLFFFLVFSF